jgi:hypothetical protein
MLPNAIRQLLDFAAVYGYDDYGSAYSTRRQWRILSLAAGSTVHLPTEVDWLGNGLPFSIKVGAKIKQSRGVDRKKNLKRNKKSEMVESERELRAK